MRRLEEMVAGFREEVLGTCATRLGGALTFSEEAANLIEEDCRWVISKAPDEVWDKASADGLGRALWRSLACLPSGGLGQLGLGDWTAEVNTLIESRGRCRGADVVGGEITFSWAR